MPKIHTDILVLSDEQIMALNGQIVPLSMVPSIWHQATKRSYDRSTAIRAHTRGRIKPIGQNRGRLYFWTHEVRQATPKPSEKRGRKPRKTE